jgi:hypothetical protein
VMKWGTARDPRGGARPWHALVNGFRIRDAAGRRMSFATKKAAEAAAKRALVNRALDSLGSAMYKAGVAARVHAAVPPGLRAALIAAPLSPSAGLHAAALPGGSAPDVLVALDACEERGVPRLGAPEYLDAMWEAGQHSQRKARKTATQLDREIAEALSYR